MRIVSFYCRFRASVQNLIRCRTRTFVSSWPSFNVHASTPVISQSLCVDSVPISYHHISFRVQRRTFVKLSLPLLVNNHCVHPHMLSLFAATACGASGFRLTPMDDTNSSFYDAELRSPSACTVLVGNFPDSPTPSTLTDYMSRDKEGRDTPIRSEIGYGIPNVIA